MDYKPTDIWGGGGHPVPFRMVNYCTTHKNADDLGIVYYCLLLALPHSLISLLAPLRRPHGVMLQAQLMKRLQTEGLSRSK